MAYRLTGLGAFGLQVEWEKVDGDRAVATRVVSYLEDRRLLFEERQFEGALYCIHSALEIRQYLTSELARAPIGRSLTASLKTMRAACRKFVEAGGPDGEFFRRRQGGSCADPFSIALGELRVVFGLHVTALASNYDLAVEEELAAIMHPALDDDGDELDFIPGFYGRRKI